VSAPTVSGLPRRRLGGALWTLGAIAIAVAVASPALRVGFLADDFYALARIDEVAREEGGLGRQLVAGIARRWSDRFHAFRPLTMASLQLDHAIFGLEPAGFRATNVALWLLAAWLFSRVCAALAGVRSPAGRAAALLTFALWPLAAEPLAWTVIRQDALLVASALGAALAVAARRRQPWVAAFPLVAALLSKETAVVLPFMLVAVDAALLLREGMARGRLAAALARRSWSWFAVLAAWWLARRAAGASDTWAGGSYAGLFASGEAVASFFARLPGAVRALFVPLNLDREGQERVVPAAILATGALAAVAAALRRMRAGDLLAASVWFVAPLAVLLPFYSVHPSLESERIVLLPGLVLLFVLATGAARLARARPIAAALACAVFLVAEAWALRYNLGAWVEASRRVEQVRSDAVDWPGGPCFLLRSRQGDALVPQLMIHEGAYVFSSAIHDALRPPFHATPLLLRPLSDEDERGLAAIVGDDPQARGAIATLLPGPAGPRLKLLCEPAAGGAIDLAPRHASILRRSDAPVLAVTLGEARAGDVCEVVFADSGGTRATPWRPLGPQHLAGETARVEFRAADFGLAGASQPLREVRAPAFLWSASLKRGGRVVARSAYAVVTLVE
jgi:hypothetical protein